MTLDDDLRDAFERERQRESADPTISARRADMLRRAAEIERLQAAEKRKAEEAACEKRDHILCQVAAVLKHTKRTLAAAREPMRPAPVERPANRPAPLPESKCPHFVVNRGRCEACFKYLG